MLHAHPLIIMRGDITQQKVDAIVNAANTSLLGGGGVDGAIQRCAGPSLLAECKKLGGCLTGQAKITKGYHLSAKWIIHTVGPGWNQGKRNEQELLASCYRNSMELATHYPIETIAFPSISTGAYRFPIELASQIAVREISLFLGKNTPIKEVQMVCFDEVTYNHYQKALRLYTP